jgi:hypothetical protein
MYEDQCDSDRDYSQSNSAAWTVKNYAQQQLVNAVPAIATIIHRLLHYYKERKCPFCQCIGTHPF